MSETTDRTIISNNLPEYAAYQALEFLAAGPRGARPGKEVRDVVRPYVNHQERLNPLKALSMIGAVSIYNRSRAQWISITPRGYRLLMDYRSNPPKQPQQQE